MFFTKKIMYGILFNIIIVCVWNFVYNISNFVVVVVIVLSLVLIKNAFGIIKTKQHKKKYETLTESPKNLHFCSQYLLTFHRKDT
jgi:nitrate/nitrite transporter NarK